MTCHERYSFGEHCNKSISPNHMLSLVYRYGLLAPISGAEQVQEQLDRAAQYRRALIEIERESRAKVKAVEEAARAALSAERSFCRETIAAQVAAIREAAKAKVREARNSCKVYWGSCLLIEKAVETAKRATPPHFLRWTGEDAVGVKITEGLRVCELGSNTDALLRLSLVPLPVPGRMGKPLPTISLRIGSVERVPIFAKWPLILHRPLPEDGVITSAKVVRRRGSHAGWSLHVTVKIPEPAPPSTPKKIVAVNLRWAPSTEESGPIIAADWAGSDGTQGVLHLDRSIFGTLKKISDLRSIRRKNFDHTKSALLATIPNLTMTKDHKARLEPLHAFRAAELGALAIWWRNNRIPGDENTFARLESWRRQDKHLFEWEHNARRKCLARRRNQYRVFASKLALSHDVLVVEKFNIARLAQTPKPEDDRERNTTTATHQGMASAPSELRKSVLKAFRRRGKLTAEVAAASSAKELLSLYHGHTASASK
jgi:hypothetical protein